MKRSMIILTAVLLAAFVCLLVSCSDNGEKSDGIPEKYTELDLDNQKPSESFDLLTSCVWEYEAESCTYILGMGANGAFINYCTCGEPVGNSDLTETFIYDDETSSVYLYDNDGKCIVKGTVKKLNDTSLTLDLFGKVCEYVKAEPSEE